MQLGACDLLSDAQLQANEQNLDEPVGFWKQMCDKYNKSETLKQGVEYEIVEQTPAFKLVKLQSKKPRNPRNNVAISFYPPSLLQHIETSL